MSASAPVELFDADGSRLEEELWKTILTDLLLDEGTAAVRDALRDVARALTSQRRCERVYDALFADVFTSLMPPLVQEARVEAVAAEILEDLVGTRVEEAAATALREARGKTARARDGAEREAVAACASQLVVDEMLLERLMAHLSTRGDALLVHRHAKQWLDEMLAEGLCRYALNLTSRKEQVRESAVLGTVHAQLAYGAMLDELIGQFVDISATGREAGLEELPDETDESDAEDETAKSDEPRWEWEDRLPQ